MSDPIASQSPTGEDESIEPAESLQFDQAEFETPAAERPSCVVCHHPIPEEYYEVSGKLMCPLCRHGFEASFRGGSRLARFLRATVFGIGAALVGSVIYYAFMRATNSNWALISILVGFMVGSAVRKGTGNRGGRIYQLLALFLTYSSIVAMHVPFFIEAMQHRPLPPAPEKVAAGKPDPREAKGKAQGQPAGDAKPQDPGAKPGPAEIAAPAPGDEPIADVRKAGQQQQPPTLGALLASLFVVLVTVIGALYTIPILVATQAPISGMIYAFALWEAWKINKPVQLVFNGPFRLGDAEPADLKPEGIDDGI